MAGCRPAGPGSRNFRTLPVQITFPINSHVCVIPGESYLQGSEISAAEPALTDSDIRPEQPLRLAGAVPVTKFSFARLVVPRRRWARISAGPGGPGRAAAAAQAVTSHGTMTIRVRLSGTVWARLGEAQAARAGPRRGSMAPVTQVEVTSPTRSQAHHNATDSLACQAAAAATGQPPSTKRRRS